MAKKARFFGLDGKASFGVIVILIALFVILLYSLGNLGRDEPSSNLVTEPQNQPPRQSAEIEPDDTSPEEGKSVSKGELFSEKEVSISDAEQQPESQNGRQSTTVDTDDTSSEEGENVSKGEPISEPEISSSDPEQPPKSQSVNPPTLDILRVAPDGTTVLAGKGDAGSLVKVLIDGVEVAATTVGANGEFALVLNLPPSANPRVMSLATQQGSKLAFAEDFIIAPTMTVVAESGEVPKPPKNNLIDSEPNSLASEVSDEQQKPDELPVIKLDTAEGETSLVADQNLLDNQLVEDSRDGSDEVAEKSLTITSLREAEISRAPPLPDTVTVLRSTPKGIERFTMDQTEVMDQDSQILLDTVSYDQRGNVLLSGRGAPNMLTVLYLNNEKRLQFSTDAEGHWNAKLESIAPDVYLLRLDALRPDGSVQSRLETPLKRESRELLSEVQSQTQEEAFGTTVSQVVIQPNDTLWAISRERYGAGILYVRVFEANRELIRDPDLIYPGQVFVVPD
ncbi:MAG: Ig-like domain-containing protein [Aestuariivita sp.]|nr:Ig-like domain-containing protein [Aestuariivita sp.]MCY4347669.1 Ig-like domain-containing protein [Aestuariivita sp.]